jgi:hypothetical protein
VRASVCRSATGLLSDVGRRTEKCYWTGEQDRKDKFGLPQVFLDECASLVYTIRQNIVKYSKLTFSVNVRSHA